MKKKPGSKNHKKRAHKSTRGLNLKEGQFFAAFVPKKK